MLRVLLLGVLLSAFAATTAQAGHFRYGSLTWRTVASDPSKLTVQFKVSQAWRRSFSAFANVTVGSTVPTDVLDFGDGTNTDIYLTVTSVDIPGDSFYGEATITHTYTTPGDFRAFYTSCCRLSTLANNANGGWYVSSLVNAGSGNNSPVTAVAPVVNLAVGQAAATFQLPASDPDGDRLTFSLAALSDFNGTPFVNAPTLAVNASTGLVTFNTSVWAVGQMFNAVIKVSDGRTSVMADFLINVTATSTAPVFDYNITPPNGFVYRVAPGEPLAFGVRATDGDPGDVVNLQAFGLPVGATVAPALPLNGNPVQTGFAWTPTLANLGTTVISFVAQDLTGVQAATSVTIEVSQGPRFDVPPTPANRSVRQVTPGTVLRATIQASATDLANTVSLVSVSGLPTGAVFGPTLPTAAANPVSTQLSWTPTVANWGPHAATFVARDRSNATASHTLNFVINSAPLFTSQPSGLTRQVGQPFVYNITATDPDLPYGDRLDLLASALPSWLRLVDNRNGTATLSGTPGPAQIGTHRVTLEAEDIYHHGNSYGMISQSFVITVVGGCNVLVQPTVTNSSCRGSNTGSIFLAVTGATAPVYYSWTGPNGFRSTGQNLSGLRAGVYLLAVTDANRCTATAEVIVSEPATAPVATATASIAGPVLPQQPTTIFLGYGPQTATLTATGGSSYQWSPATGLSNPTSANPVFTPTAAGQYTFTVTAVSASGCRATAATTVTVVEARCGNNPRNPKVLICHNGHEICVSPNAVPAHIGPGSSHTDYLGSCTSTGGRTAPAEVVLEAFPNPIAGSTVVSFRAPETAVATVRVYNQMGVLMVTLFNDVAVSGRDYPLELDAAQWPNGLYICHFISKGKTQTQRLMVNK